MMVPKIWSRVAAEWKIKVFLGGMITALFWAGYFFLGRIHVFPVTEMPSTVIDQSIPFRPAAAGIYLSQFLTLPAVLWLMSSRWQLLACCRGLAFLMGVSFAVFLVWPTAVTRPETSPGQHPLYDLIIRHDLARNACPSLHAGFALFIAGCAWDVFRGWPFRRWLIGAVWLLTGAVLVSTLLIKQHVIFDLMAGGVLGITSWLLTRPKSGALEALRL